MLFITEDSPDGVYDACLTSYPRLTIPARKRRILDCQAQDSLSLCAPMYPGGMDFSRATEAYLFFDSGYLHKEVCRTARLATFQSSAHHVGIVSPRRSPWHVEASRIANEEKRFFSRQPDKKIVPCQRDPSVSVPYAMTHVISTRAPQLEVCARAASWLRCSCLIHDKTRSVRDHRPVSCATVRLRSSFRSRKYHADALSEPTMRRVCIESRMPRLRKPHRLYRER